MKKWKSTITAASLSLFASLATIGFGGWIIQGSKTAQYEKYHDSTAQKVAYIKNGGITTYYTTIEKAIDVANGIASSNPTIFVIPGVHYTLRNNGTSLKTVTINSGVTLSLPFQDELLFEVWKTGTKKDANGNDVSDGVYNPSGTQFSTTVEALLKPETYRETQITIDRNVKLVNNGTINVGGVNGSCSGGQVPAGQTCYKFSEIVLNGLNDVESYQLINNGTIKNQGRIIGSDNSIFGIENTSGSNLVSNFVVRENKGGSALVGLGGGIRAALSNELSFSVSPFNRVYMPNTMVKMKTDFGANVTGVANMYGNDANNLCEISVLSSSTSSLFTLKSGSYLISNVYLDSLENKSGTTIVNNYEKMKLDFYGSGSMQYMSMDLAVPVFGSRSIKTDTVLFPLSYYQEVSLNSINGKLATFESKQDLKVLPGGSLAVGQNVSFQVGKLAIYDSFTDNIGWTSQKYPQDLKAGNFEVTGSFNGTQVGGFIGNNSTTAVMKISNNSITSKEVKGTLGKDAATDKNYDSISLTARGNTSSDGLAGETKDNDIIEPNISYKSCEKSDSCYWYKYLVICSYSLVTENLTRGGNSTESEKNMPCSFRVTLNVSKSDGSTPVFDSYEFNIADATEVTKGINANGMPYIEFTLPKTPDKNWLGKTKTKTHTLNYSAVIDGGDFSIQDSQTYKAMGEKS